MPDRLGAPPAGPVLILTPTGRDAAGAARLLDAEQIDHRICPTLDRLQAEIGDAAGLVLLADEALFRADLAALTARLSAQPPWSDLPFVVLTQAGIGARRQTAELDLPRKLGNVLLLERPLNAISLLSAVRTALRARQRQRQVRQYLDDQVGAAERAAALLEARVHERTEALEAAEAERRQIAEALRHSQKMEAVGQLTGGLAHDFNNLLTGVTGSLELLQTRLAQGRTEDADRYIDAAQGAARRAASLTHRLLAFSRRQTLDPKPTGVDRLVRGLEELIRRTVGPGITVETPAPASCPWPTLVDQGQLENALLNLCINARDAMPDGGTITIETANYRLDEREARERELPPGLYVCLRVSDTGTGMPAEVIGKAFDPFFTTKPIGQGTGLGLSMIYGFARQSGGQARITSEVGRGTTVRLYLPRHLGAEDGTEMLPEIVDAPRAEWGETVLVVDDEPTVRMLVAEVLEDLGYTAAQAPDAACGLEMLRSEMRVDLLVTDVGLPGGMNGRQLADAARALRPGLRVLFITGYAETAVLGAGHLDPGMHVLAKPFALDALAGRIKDLIALP